jgi:D-apiose dehydrogenase
VNDEKQTRIAIVGCGFYAQNHLHAWKHLHSKGANLVAVCDLDPAEAAGKRFEAPWFTNVDKMLDAVDVDMVDIATRMDSHRQLAAKLADRKLAANVQKPFATKWDGCVAIVEYARSKGTWLAVHENFRFTSAIGVTSPAKLERKST